MRRTATESAERWLPAGLLLKQPSDSINTNVMPDGGEAQATFRAGNFDGHWPSQTEISTTVAVERQGDRHEGHRAQYRQLRPSRSGSAGIRDLRF